MQKTYKVPKLSQQKDFIWSVQTSTNNITQNYVVIKLNVLQVQARTETQSQGLNAENILQLLIICEVSSKFVHRANKLFCIRPVAERSIGMTLTCWHLAPQQLHVSAEGLSHFVKSEFFSRNRFSAKFTCFYHMFFRLFFLRFKKSWESQHSTQIGSCWLLKNPIRLSCWLMCVQRDDGCFGARVHSSLVNPRGPKHRLERWAGLWDQGRTDSGRLQ